LKSLAIYSLQEFLISCRSGACSKNAAASAPAGLPALSAVSGSAKNARMQCACETSSDLQQKADEEELYQFAENKGNQCAPLARVILNRSSSA
jgi:hypothetical protein